MRLHRAECIEKSPATPCITRNLRAWVEQAPFSRRTRERESGKAAAQTQCGGCGLLIFTITREGESFRSSWDGNNKARRVHHSMPPGLELIRSFTWKISVSRRYKSESRSLDDSTADKTMSRLVSTCIFLRLRSCETATLAVASRPLLIRPALNLRFHGNIR